MASPASADIRAVLFVDADLLNRWITGLLSLSLAGNNTYNIARIAKFAHGYFGKTAGASSGLMATVNYWRNPHFQAMKAAGNALGLLYLTSWLPNPQIMLEARKAHITAANLLRKEVEKPCVDFMAVLGAAEALISCEAYNLVSSGPAVTTTHLSGIMDVLRSITHQAATATIRVFLFRKFRHLSLMQSLVSRRALAGEHIWWLCSKMQPPSDVESLMQLAVRLPALIETANIVRRSCDPDDQVVKGLRSQLLRLEIDFAEWLSEYESRTGQPKVDMEITVYWLGNRPVVARPSLSFSSFMDATCHALYWICLLLLRQALMPLIEPSNATIHRPLPAEIDLTADHLCASIPYLARTAGGTVNQGVSVIAPLHFAREWFEQNGNDLKLRWCCETEEAWRMRLPFLQWCVSQAV